MKIKNFILTIIIAVAGVVPFISSPAFAVSCPPDSVRGDAPTLAECNVPEDNSLLETVTNIMNVAIGVIGLVAVAVIIIGGLNYVMSEGEAARIQKAKTIILYGIIGLVIAILAFAIVNFVMANALQGGSGGGGGGQNYGTGGEGADPLLK